MCYSFEISLGTGIVSWIVSIFILVNRTLSEKERKSIIFFMIFSSMQFIDAILWYIKLKKNNINYVVTSLLIPLILSFQIIYNLYVIEKVKSTLVDVIVVIFIVYIFTKFNGYSRASLCDSNRLSSPIWGNSEITLIEFAIFILLIGYSKDIYSVIKLGLIFSLFVLLIHLKGYKSGYGSLWCAIACVNIFYYIYKHILNEK